MNSHPLDELGDDAPHAEEGDGAGEAASLEARLRNEEEQARQEAIRRSQLEAKEEKKRRAARKAGGSARAKVKSPGRRTPPGTPPRKPSAEPPAGPGREPTSPARREQPDPAPGSPISDGHAWFQFDAKTGPPRSPPRPREVPSLDLEKFFRKVEVPPPQEAQSGGATQKPPAKGEGRPPARSDAAREVAPKPSLEEMLNELHEGEDAGGVLEKFVQGKPAARGGEGAAPAPAPRPAAAPKSEARGLVPPSLFGPAPPAPPQPAPEQGQIPAAAAAAAAAAEAVAAALVPKPAPEPARAARRAHTAPAQEAGARATPAPGPAAKKETLAERVQRRQGEHKERQKEEQRQQEEVEAKRREVRRRLLSELSPFMPEQHVLKPQISSLPNAKMGLPKAGEMCNRYCALECVRESTSGFLQAADIKMSQNQPSVSQLQNALRKSLRRFHPDRNRAAAVGLEKSIMSEEQCKVASLLQTLFEEADSLDITVTFAGPGGGSWKFRTSRSSTLADVKQRVKDEDPSLSIESMQLRVQGARGGALGDGAKTLGECGIQHNSVLELTISAGLGSSQQSNWARFE